MVGAPPPQLASTAMSMWVCVSYTWHHDLQASLALLFAVDRRASTRCLRLYTGLRPYTEPLDGTNPSVVHRADTRATTDVALLWPNTFRLMELLNWTEESHAFGIPPVF